MLVLSRKLGERILIGDQVAVTIVRIGPNAVRVGIDAPKEMNIVREEIADGKQNPETEVLPPQGGDRIIVFAVSHQKKKPKRPR